MVAHRNAAPAQPERVVVLGASGFVGRDLMRHLATAGVAKLALSSSDIDLCEPGSVAKLGATLREDDALVFVSALTPDKGRDVATLMKNLRMAENVCSCLETLVCRQVVYISSDAVYADGTNPVRETSCASPSSLHGVMHLVRERMLSHVLGNSQVPLLIVRPSLLYGPGDTHGGYGPNRFLRSARDERKIVLFGDGEEKRDHVWIADLSSLISMALAHRSQGVLNVAAGASISFLEAAETTAMLCPDPVRIERLPRSASVTHRHFDIGETLRAYPSFTYTSFPEGLGKTWEHWLKPANG